MNVLFVMRHAGYVRNFESVLHSLVEMGHHVHVAFEASPRSWMGEAGGVVERLAEEYPHFSHGLTPTRGADSWAILARRVRLASDYLRYLGPPYRDAPKLRARAEQRAPRIARRVASLPLLRTTAGRVALAGALRLIERSLPISPPIAAFVRAHRPDILLVTPLVELGSPQTDYVRAAQSLGVRTGLCVASWDNLTNKGLIRDSLDVVAVWNEPMKREAVEMHGVPAKRVVVTGAQAYDHWFGWTVSTSRADFCARLGLPANRPILLYLCSSSFIAPDETGFVRAWLHRLRSAGDDRLRGVGVVVRPHPQNAEQWRDVDLASLGPIAVWPRAGAGPVDWRSKADYYDSIAHSAAVIGVNTSALIESAIVGRPVYTLLAPEFRSTQAGTLHFHHLLRVNGGLLRVASTFEEHAAQLSEALTTEGCADGQAHRFLEAFIRPHGLDVAATPRLVAAIEEVAARPAPRLRQPPRSAIGLHPLLALVASYPRWRGLLRPNSVAPAGRGALAAEPAGPERKSLA